ncbi:MAG: hypothetical protein SFW66_05580 [Gammaproteobacteria bacterium]|nr:hypothetical protein [Gammaproteobacteria bacterium]
MMKKITLALLVTALSTTGFAVSASAKTSDNVAFTGSDLFYCKIANPSAQGTVRVDTSHIDLQGANAGHPPSGEFAQYIATNGHLQNIPFDMINRYFFRAECSGPFACRGSVTVAITSGTADDITCERGTGGYSHEWAPGAWPGVMSTKK